MRRLSVFRLVLFLLCLIGAQHAALVHALEHLPAGGAAIAQLQQDGDSKAGDHALACVGCLAAHTFATCFSGTPPRAPESALTHVYRAPLAVRSGGSTTPEPRAHGPPPISLL
ncbi:MAG TPA: hypothetical protein VIO81_08020 [Methyloversatilis sp.]